MQINRKLMEKILYSDDNGTNFVVTLSETSKNFKYIEVLFKNMPGTGAGSIKIYNPDGKGFDMGLFVTIPSPLKIFFVTCRAIIDGLTITPSTYGSSDFTSTSQQVDASTNAIYIYRVIGYR